MRAHDYVNFSRLALEPHGFFADNTVAAVSDCRDELCRPFDEEVRSVWGEAFMLGGLGGMLTAGRTGVGALCHHALVDEGRNRFVFFAMAHIGLARADAVGTCRRPGHDGHGYACGAVIALQHSLSEGEETPSDPDDIEASYLRRHVAPLVDRDDAQDLVKLTGVVADVIQKDFERLIEQTLSDDITDHALLSGILVHAADGETWVAPRDAYARVSGTVVPLPLR
jgi:hypothetical protein